MAPYWKGVGFSSIKVFEFEMSSGKGIDHSPQFQLWVGGTPEFLLYGWFLPPTVETVAMELHNEATRKLYGLNFKKGLSGISSTFQGVKHAY